MSEKDCLVVEDSVIGLQVEFIAVRLSTNFMLGIKEDE